MSEQALRVANLARQPHASTTELRNALIRLGRSYCLNTRYEASERVLQQALALSGDAAGSFEQGLPLASLADLYLTQNRLREAEQAYLQAQAALGQPPDAELLASTWNGLGVVPTAET